MEESKLTPKATYQDVIDAPFTMIAEIVGGKLYTYPRSDPIFSNVLGGLLGNLLQPFTRRHSGPGGWCILHRVEVHLGEDVLVPDLAGWRLERLPENINLPYLAIAPDWVCEVISPITHKPDIGKKSAIYAREGVPHFWVVDIVKRSLEVSELRGTEWAMIDKVFDHAQVPLPPFDAITFDLGGLWPSQTLN